MINKNEADRRPRGRPRAFDREKALAAAGATFWKLGDEGASLVDLTEAMAITPQSLYAAFKSKADLFRESLGWYLGEVGSAARAALDEPDVVEAFRQFYAASVRQFCSEDQPRGCMLSAALVNCGSEHSGIAKEVAGYRAASIALFQARLERARAAHQLKDGTDCAALARYLGAIVQGLSIQANDGASAGELDAVAALAVTTIASARR